MLSPKGTRSLRKFVLKFKSACIKQPILALVDDIYFPFNMDSPYVISVIGLKHALQAICMSYQVKERFMIVKFLEEILFQTNLNEFETPSVSGLSLIHI